MIFIRRISISILSAAILLSTSACQLANPPSPTEIPTVTETLGATNAPDQPTNSPPPDVTLAPIVTSTALAPTAVPVALEPTIPPTAGPYCYTVETGQTLETLLVKAGYRTYDVLDEVLTLNNLASSSSIQVGQQICIPRQTSTPTPPGYAETVVARLTELGNVNVVSNRTIGLYNVVDGDTLISIQLKTGASLRELCDLNNPDPLNCGGCQIDKPIGEQACRPTIRSGIQLKIYGPTPTPTITPTLSGSETATPTPVYRSPRVVAPLSGEHIPGAAQLVWLPPTVLQQGEYYLILMTDSTAGANHTFETEATSFRIPSYMQPTDAPHTINWQVVIARKGKDGAHIQVGKGSLIYTFVWEPLKQ